MSTAGTLLGFDFGLKRIGVAVGQSLTGARPLTTLTAEAGDPDWAAVDDLLDDWNPAALVVGVPYNVDGSAHGMTTAAEHFASRLEAHTRLEVHRVDERYTSLEAAHEHAARRRLGTRRAAHDELDAVAAAVILQGWIDGGMKG